MGKTETTSAVRALSRSCAHEMGNCHRELEWHQQKDGTSPRSKTAQSAQQHTVPQMLGMEQIVPHPGILSNLTCRAGKSSWLGSRGVTWVLETFSRY